MSKENYMDENGVIFSPEDYDYALMFELFGCEKFTIQDTTLDQALSPLRQYEKILEETKRSKTTRYPSLANTCLLQF